MTDPASVHRLPGGRHQVPSVLVTIALLVVGCTSEPVSPRPTTRSEAPSHNPLQSVGASETPQATLALPPSMELEQVGLSCGSPVAFHVRALDAPAGAERAGHPAAEALRDLLRTDNILPDRGWRTVALTETAALFLVAVPSNTEHPYWSAEFEQQNGAWSWVRYGQCNIRPMFEGAEPATWDLAPEETLTVETQAIDVLITEMACASGSSPEGRILAPAIVYEETSLLVTIGVRPRGGAQTCQGNPSFRMTVEFTEPLGDRELYDGSVFPPEKRGGPP